MQKIKLLISSVGSFVGQNILDVFEYPGFNRRNRVEIIGTNSLAESPNNFRCDKCYLVPDLINPAYEKKIIEIISTEKPDLILSARDQDTNYLNQLFEKHPHLRGKTPSGNTNSLKLGLNKRETLAFCKRNNLPFAMSFVPEISGGIDAFKHFAKKARFPMISKPVEGFASKGVFLVRNIRDAIPLLHPDNIFQEYLGDTNEMNKYLNSFRGPIPLFTQTTDNKLYSSATVISPDGEIAPILILENHHQYGQTINTRQFINEELETIARTFALAYISEGGAGPISIQFKRDAAGQWKAMEMNLRSNGNTFVRFLLGQDELAYTINWFLPHVNFPFYQIANNCSHQVIKTLHPHMLPISEIDSLVRTGTWP